MEDAWSVHNDFVTGTFSTGGDDVITLKVPEQSELKFDYDYGNKDDYSKYTI